MTRTCPAPVSGAGHGCAHRGEVGAGQDAAAELGVKAHVTRLLAELGVRDRVQAVVRAYETGLVRPGAP